MGRKISGLRRDNIPLLSEGPLEKVQRNIAPVGGNKKDWRVNHEAIRTAFFHSVSTTKR